VVNIACIGSIPDAGYCFGEMIVVGADGSGVEIAYHVKIQSANAA